MALIWRNYNFRIYPSKEQERSLDKMFFCTRFVYNHYVEMGRKLFVSLGRYPTYQENLKTLPALVRQHVFLQEADPESLPLALHNLSRAYKNHADMKEYQPPSFKSKNNGRQSYMTKYKSGNKLISNHKIILPIIGAVSIVVHRPIARCFRPLYITVVRKPSWEYEVSLAIFAPDHLYNKVIDHDHIVVSKKSMVQNGKEDNETAIRAIGLDFSMPDLVIDSEGNSAGYPHYYKQLMQKLAREQHRLSKCIRGSKNYQKQRIRVARVMQKCASQRQDYQHKLSRKLTDQYNLVCIEDLSIKRMIANTRLGKSAYDDGWYQFVQMLAYKLAESGKNLQKIGRWYPSSRTCSQCGRVIAHLELDERTYRCQCGYTASRDVNAAINIKREGERLYNKQKNQAHRL